MSTYIDTYRVVYPHKGQASLTFEIDHSWADFTERRLDWLYGPNHKTERAALTTGDVAAWNGPGERRVA